MKHLIVFAFAALLAANLHAASPAATQAWVTNYVANTTVKTINATNGVEYVMQLNGEPFTLYVENYTVSALRATNVTSAAVALNVTNGMYFVWNDLLHSYTNHGETITATPSNFVWRTFQSANDTFTNYFSVVGTKLQPTYAKEVTK